MTVALIRVVFTLAYLSASIIALAGVYYGGTKVWSMWSVQDVDRQAMAAAARKLAAKPTSTFTDLVKERPGIKLTWTVKPGKDIVPDGTQRTITADSRMDLLQYLLTITNASHKAPVSATVSVQLPAYIMSQRVAAGGGADVAEVIPGTSPMTVHVEGQGTSATVNGIAISQVCSIRIVNLAPDGGQVSVVLDVNAWLDELEAEPLKKADDNPPRHYVLAKTTYEAEGEKLKDTFFAPFVMNESRTIVMGDVLRGDAGPETVMVTRGQVLLSDHAMRRMRIEKP